MPRQLSDWLQGYAEYTAQSDSPQIFHMWCALGTVAGAAQRKIFMRTAYFDVLTNMYILLVSPPGRGKKSSALRTAKSILKDVEPKVNFVSESGSFEGLIGAMAKISNPAHQSMTLYSMEFGSIMATNPVGMVDFLTDIYDGNPDWERQTVKHDIQSIKRPWLNIMSGTTPKWLSERMGLIALEGGLIARTTLAYSDELLLDNPWPKETPALKALKKALVNDLSVIATLDGEFLFEGGEEGDAFQWYTAWYKNRPSPLLESPFTSRYPSVMDPRTAGYFDRKHIHLLKVAMLLSLTHKNELTIDLVDLKRALKFLDSTEHGMRLALNAVGRNERTGELGQILAQIRSRGKMEYAELLVENFHNLRYGKKGLDEALGELRMMGHIEANGTTFSAVYPNGNGKA